MHPTLVTPPASLPISASDVIARAPSLAGASEAVVTALIEAAVSHLDGWSGVLGRCLVEQTWAIEDACHSGWSRYYLPFGDVRSIEAVRIDGVALNETAYLWCASGRYVAPVSPPWPTGSVEIEFTAGYGGPDDVPAAIKQAIVMMVAGLYATTEANGGLRSFQSEGAFTEQFNSPEMIDAVRTRAVDMLLAPFRRLSV